MSEETTIKPCPVCGGEGSNAERTPSDLRWVDCYSQDCPLKIPLPLEDWNRLSDAAALARAADVLGAWLQESTSHGLDMVRSRDGLNYVASTVDYVGGGYYHKRAHGATPAAALIALAEQVNE